MSRNCLMPLSRARYRTARPRKARYTDGLVESRTRSFDQGILAMRSILAREHGHLEAICDALIASLAGRCEDDITVVLARIPAGRAG
jgi:hypothetical protein